MSSGGSRGGSGGSGPPYQTWRLFETEILTSTWSYITFNWLIFLMKHALHFATKLNSRDIQKCNCFWVPSYDLFAFARKAVFSAGNGDRRSQIEKHVAVSVRNNLPLKSSTVLSEPKFGSPPPPNQKFLDPPLGLMMECSFSFSGRWAGLLLGVWGERQLRYWGFWETAYLPLSLSQHFALSE